MAFPSPAIPKRQVEPKEIDLKKWWGVIFWSLQ